MLPSFLNSILFQNFIYDALNVIINMNMLANGTAIYRDHEDVQSLYFQLLS